MKRIPVRLGPLALLLCVISICMATLSMLSYANAGADLRLAERYAETVYTRYALELEGEEFIRDAAQSGSAQSTRLERNGYILEIAFDGEHITNMRMEKEWEENTGIQDLWEGD